MNFQDKIFETYQKMLGENRFLQEDELNESYALFKSNFGPEKLMSLDGELLLETMFNHGNRGALFTGWNSKTMMSFGQGALAESVVVVL